MTGVLLAMGVIVVIDRIEGGYAVLEWRDTTVTEVPVEVLPPDVEEGDRLLLRARTLPRFSAIRGRGRGSHGAVRARGRRAE